VTSADTSRTTGAAPAPDDAPLASTVVGAGPRRVAFVHGLMGRGRNFNGIAQALADQFTVEMIDMPDHGQSPWSEGVDYRRIADRIADHLRAGLAADGPVHLVGHSMGGKAVMALALRHPELVERLVVVDISPRTAVAATDVFVHLLGTMLEMDLDSYRTRSDAEAAMAEKIPDERIRGFLLQNLRRDRGRFTWQPNVAMLLRDLEVIGSFPDPMVEEDPERTYDGPVLWIGGADSDYILDADVPRMRQLFPKAVRVTIREAGHWVHADRPDAFVDAVRHFLTQD
jgi:pimeloyl-ACP methyl ester carboxylesterase